LLLLFVVVVVVVVGCCCWLLVVGFWLLLVLVVGCWLLVVGWLLLLLLLLVCCVVVVDDDGDDENVVVVLVVLWRLPAVFISCSFIFVYLVLLMFYQFETFTGIVVGGALQLASLPLWINSFRNADSAALFILLFSSIVALIVACVSCLIYYMCYRSW